MGEYTLFKESVLEIIFAVTIISILEIVKQPIQKFDFFSPWVSDFCTTISLLIFFYFCSLKFYVYIFFIFRPKLCVSWRKIFFSETFCNKWIYKDYIVMLNWRKKIILYIVWKKTAELSHLITNKIKIFAVHNFKSLKNPPQNIQYWISYMKAHIYNSLYLPG